MVISSFLYFALNLCFDLDSTKKLYTKIKTECQRIIYRYDTLEDDYSSTKSSHSEATLEAHDLKKAYSGKNIVRNINFTLTRGECMGILGVNGAGKTTTFRMLTKEEFPDKGTVKIYEDNDIPLSDNQVRILFPMSSPTTSGIHWLEQLPLKTFCPIQKVFDCIPRSRLWSVSVESAINGTFRKQSRVCMQIVKQ